MFQRITTEQAQELRDAGIVYYDAPPLAVQLVEGLYYKRYPDADWPKVLTWDAFHFPEYSYYLLLEE